jgi:hypothetical protein
MRLSLSSCQGSLLLRTQDRIGIRVTLGVSVKLFHGDPVHRRLQPDSSLPRLLRLLPAGATVASGSDIFQRVLHARVQRLVGFPRNHSSSTYITPVGRAELSSDNGILT